MSEPERTLFDIESIGIAVFKTGSRRSFSREPDPIIALNDPLHKRLRSNSHSVGIVGMALKFAG
jgi:hypothetical protein